MDGSERDQNDMDDSDLYGSDMDRSDIDGSNMGGSDIDGNDMVESDVDGSGLGASSPDLDNKIFGLVHVNCCIILSGSQTGFKPKTGGPKSMLSPLNQYPLQNIISH